MTDLIDSPRPSHPSVRPNGARPRRRRLLVGAATAIAAAFVLTGCMTDRERSAFDLINAERAAAGAAPLAEDVELTIAAREFAEQLAQEGRLRHSDVGRLFGGGRWSRLGENVGFGADRPGSENVMQDAYRRSTVHRDNQVGAFTHGGVGIATSPDGRVFQVQLFAATSGR